MISCSRLKARPVYSDATQLDITDAATQLNCRRRLSWVASASLYTLRRRSSTQLDVEFCRYKRPYVGYASVFDCMLNTYISCRIVHWSSYGIISNYHQYDLLSRLRGNNDVTVALMVTMVSLAHVVIIDIWYLWSSYTRIFYWWTVLVLVVTIHRERRNDLSRQLTAPVDTSD